MFFSWTILGSINFEVSNKGYKDKKKHSKFNRAVKSTEFYADFKTVEMFILRKLSAEIHF